MARLYLIRHAQSANNEIWNGSDHVDGRSPDPELTATGHRQAETLGQHLSHPHAEPRQHPFLPTKEVHFGLTHVYCSLMTRSILTAGYIANPVILRCMRCPIYLKKTVFTMLTTPVICGAYPVPIAPTSSNAFRT